MRNSEKAPETEGVESVLRACQILQVFRSDEELLRLRDVIERTSLSKTTAYRLLLTLNKAGMLDRIGSAQFRRRFSPVARTTVRIGFAAQSSDSTFSRLVSESIHRAATAYGVELIEADNRYSPKVALKNADMLIGRRVDIVLEFQTYENVAPVIASRFLQARIPVIAIEIPHPGTIYFGADNYQAGLIGGRAMAKWAKANWGGHVEDVLLLREFVAGPVPGYRVTGMLAGMRDTLPWVRDTMVTTLDGKGNHKASYEAVKIHLRRRLPVRTLIAANNDPSALGALQAVHECGWTAHCAVMSQNCLPEAREEMRKPGTRLIGSVAYFPERYGDQLIPMALSIVSGEQVPSSVFAKHTLVTPQNVDRFYPKDAEAAAKYATAGAGISGDLAD